MVGDNARMRLLSHRAIFDYHNTGNGFDANGENFQLGSPENPSVSENDGFYAKQWFMLKMPGLCP